MRFMQTELVLQTKNRSGPAKIRFSVALVPSLPNMIVALGISQNFTVDHSFSKTD